MARQSPDSLASKRNLYTGRSFWVSARLPSDPAQRAGRAGGRALGTYGATGEGGVL